jgi:pimeloyl-ACP methyl ester carboxylesterase
MSAALWAGRALLPAFEAVTGASITALDFGSAALPFFSGYKTVASRRTTAQTISKIDRQMPPFFGGISRWQIRSGSRPLSLGQGGHDGFRLGRCVGRTMTFPITEYVAKSQRHASFYLACGKRGATPIIFLHGWPELSISWRHQLGVASY